MSTTPVLDGRTCGSCGYAARTGDFLCAECRAVLPRAHDPRPTRRPPRERRRPGRRTTAAVGWLLVVGLLGGATVVLLDPFAPEPPGPAAVSEAWVRALSELDCEEVGELVAFGYVPDDDCRASDAYFASVEVGEIDVVEEDVDGRHATARVRAALDGRLVDWTISMVRHSGEWKVSEVSLAPVDPETGDVSA